jgi:hypothetical protein
VINNGRREAASLICGSSCICVADSTFTPRCRHLSRFLLVYVACSPLALWPKLGWATVVVAPLITLLLVCPSPQAFGRIKDLVAMSGSAYIRVALQFQTGVMTPSPVHTTSWMPWAYPMAALQAAITRVIEA